MAQAAKKNIRTESLAIAIVAILLALGGSFWATQEAARRFDYQPALSGKLLDIAEASIYQPFAIWNWAERWSRQYPRAFAIPKLVAGGSLLSAIGILLLAFRRRPPSLSPFGASAWGDQGDAHDSGLFAAEGVVIGKIGREILCHDGPAHVLVTGGTRSGKTRGAVIPTLLAWPHSAVVLDVKDELFEGDGRNGFPGVAGFREQMGPVIRLAFTAPESASFNVLDCVRKGSHEVRDVQNIVEIIADPYGDGRHADFWDRSAKALLTGLILHVLYAEENKTLQRVFELLADLDETAKRMEATYHLKDPQTGRLMIHPVVLRGAMSYRKNHEKIRMGIKATAESFLTLFDDPLVQARTAKSDFSIDDLMCAERPVTLFLAWPPAESVRLKPLIRMALAPILYGLMEKQEEGQRGQPKKHDLLLVLDEFPQLGRIDFFEKSLSAMASYGLRALLVTQSLNFVNQAYGAKNTILDNCAILAVLGANDAQTAETVSRLAGETYEMRPQETWVSKSFGFGPDQRSISYREEKRALILPGDVRALPSDQMLIFVEGARPLKAQKLKYDQEPFFRTRLQAFERRPFSLNPNSDWVGLRGFGLKPPPLATPRGASSNTSSRSNTGAARAAASGDLFDRDWTGARGEPDASSPETPGVHAEGDAVMDAAAPEARQSERPPGDGRAEAAESESSQSDEAGSLDPSDEVEPSDLSAESFAIEAAPSPVRRSRFDLRGQLKANATESTSANLKSGGR